MVIVSWMILISLNRPGTIGQDEVEIWTSTIFVVVFKASELVKLSTPQINHVFSRVLESLDAIYTRTHQLCQPDYSYCSHPLANSLVIQFVDALQLDRLPVVAQKLSNHDEALGSTDVTTQFCCSACLWPMLDQ